MRAPTGSLVSHWIVVLNGVSDTVWTPMISIGVVDTCAGGDVDVVGVKTSEVGTVVPSAGVDVPSPGVAAKVRLSNATTSLSWGIAAVGKFVVDSPAAGASACSPGVRVTRELCFQALRYTRRGTALAADVAWTTTAGAAASRTGGPAARWASVMPIPPPTRAGTSSHRENGSRTTNASACMRCSLH